MKFCIFLIFGKILNLKEQCQKIVYLGPYEQVKVVLRNFSFCEDVRQQHGHCVSLVVDYADTRISNIVIAYLQKGPRQNIKNKIRFRKFRYTVPLNQICGANLSNFRQPIMCARTCLGAAVVVRTATPRGHGDEGRYCRQANRHPVPQDLYTET